jgi:hypothetical protein
VKINDQNRGSIDNTDFKLNPILVLHHIHKGLNFLDIRYEKGKQENAILTLRTMKQPHYWNTYIHYASGKLTTMHKNFLLCL